MGSHYPFLWLEAIHYKVKTDGRYEEKAVYTVPGLNRVGKKEILGLYLSESEDANFWLSVLTDPDNPGVEDILIAAVHGLSGFPEAVHSIFPKTEVQLCIIHPVYKAVSKEAAEMVLDELESRWGEQYPIVLKSWRGKWENLSAYFKYPADIRRAIYTTNAIEAVHRQFRKLTKTKGAFPSDNSLLKLLYVGIQNASKKWTMPISSWSLTLSQLSIYFEGCLVPPAEIDSKMNSRKRWLFVKLGFNS
uniref:Mutator family transposase n=1 Tax=Candidatus Kentrum eta TaxID=2126337 RepID=A0A450VHD0_9GAMM|nr:MAG: Transposase, Mutator family [Candidatus Kentron sp. H]